MSDRRLWGQPEELQGVVLVGLPELLVYHISRHRPQKSRDCLTTKKNAKENKKLKELKKRDMQKL